MNSKRRIPETSRNISDLQDMYIQHHYLQATTQRIESGPQNNTSFWLWLGYSQFSDVYLCQTRVVITKLVEMLRQLKLVGWYQYGKVQSSSQGRMSPAKLANAWASVSIHWWTILKLGFPPESWVLAVPLSPIQADSGKLLNLSANLPAHPTSFLSPLKVSTYVWIIDYALSFWKTQSYFIPGSLSFQHQMSGWLGTNTRFTQPSWILQVNLKIGCFLNLL